MDFTFHVSTLILRACVAVRYLERSNTTDRDQRSSDVSWALSGCLNYLSFPCLGAGITQMSQTLNCLIQDDDINKVSS